MKPLAIALLLVTGLPTVAAAHEIGKTQATLIVPGDGTYRVEVVIDPDALLTKLQALSGRAVMPPVSRADRDNHLQARSGDFLSRVTVAFDGRPVTPTFRYTPVSALGDLAQAPAAIALSGRLPAGATTFTFRNALASGTYALNVRIGDSEVRTAWIQGAETSAPQWLMPTPPRSTVQTSAQYLALGYTHILPNGLDHILFVLGIFLLTTNWRSVLLQVSTFTLAHSITLALTMYGFVSLPARIVEPMIAVSIAYVAIENLVTGELKPWRLALVFGFGLLHGMGFAGVLRDLGLPRSQFLTALVSFNVGVEAGQLSVIALALAAVTLWRSDPVVYRRLVVRPASLAIACAGLLWTVQRLFSIA